jgi:hypothetical protein
MSNDIESVEVVDNVPHVIHKGVYTLWEKPDGSLRIQYHRDDKEEEDFFELPGAMVKLAKAAEQGKMNPMDMIKEVTKMMMSRPQ